MGLPEWVRSLCRRAKRYALSRMPHEFREAVESDPSESVSEASPESGFSLGGIPSEWRALKEEVREVRTHIRKLKAAMKTYHETE